MPLSDEERRQAADFARLDYDGFRRLAAQPGLSAHERIGFPDSLRAGREEAIWGDIRRKLPALEAGAGLAVMDIGPGCAGLPRLMMALCAARGHALTLVDSPEMLAALPDGAGIAKLPGRFPEGVAGLEALAGTQDAVLCYSVLHYAFTGGQVFAFLDAALRLLRPGGALLLGDVPNASMRRRFLASAAGRAFHRAWTGRDEDPEPGFNTPVEGEMDDAVVMALLARARAAGADAWVLPQPPELPMANRREDILVRRP